MNTFGEGDFHGNAPHTYAEVTSNQFNSSHSHVSTICEYSSIGSKTGYIWARGKSHV